MKSHPVSLSVTALAILAGPIPMIAACGDCTVEEQARVIAGDDTTYCGYAEPNTEGRDEIFDCFYAAIEEGYAAWVAFDVSEDWSGDEPAPSKVAFVFDGEVTLSSLLQYHQCWEFEAVGPCIVSHTCEPSGVVRGPEEVAGPAYDP